MRKVRSPKPYFVLLSGLTGFFIGVLYTLWMLPEGTGLSGPGHLFWNAVAGIGLCLGLSLLLKDRFGRKRITQLNVLLFLVNLIPITWLVFRIFMLDPAPRSDMEDNPDPERMVDPSAAYRYYFPENTFSEEFMKELDKPSVRILESGDIEIKSDDGVDSVDGPALP